MKYLLIIIALMMSAPSQATLIELTVDQNEYQLNQTINAQLIASELSYTLGAFAGTIAFDENVLALTSWRFGDGFDDGFGSWSFADDSVAGQLYLEDFADASADEFTISANQGNRFVLASFTFKALSAGQHTLELLAGLEVISFDNIDQQVFDRQSTGITVSQVPEPSTALLLAASLFILRRKLG